MLTTSNNYSLFAGAVNNQVQPPVKQSAAKTLIERLVRLSDYIDDFDIIVKRAKTQGINGEQVILIDDLAQNNKKRKLKMTIDRLLFMKANPQQAFILDEPTGKLMVQSNGTWYYLMSSCDANGKPVWCKSSCQDINNYDTNLLPVCF